MGFFDKVTNLFRGFFALFGTKLTQQNPEEAIRGVIEKRKGNHKVIKKKVGTVLFQRNKLADEIISIDEELNNVQLQLEGAVADGNDAVAMSLMQRRDDAKERLQSTKEQHLVLEDQAEEMLGKLQQYEMNIKDLEKKLEDVRRNSAVIDVMTEIQGLDDLYGNSDAEILDEIERGQAEQIAHLKVDEELAERDGSKQLEEYQVSAEQRRRQQELDEMKAKLAGRTRVEAEEAEQVTEVDEEVETKSSTKTI
jgi:phage shock protein A